MTSRALSIGTTIALATGALLAVGARPGSAREAARFGPPWISIETPVNPYDAATRGAFLVVHTFHHGLQLDVPIAGTAEGIVNGQRRTIPLQFGRTSRPGAYVVRKQWSDGGVWTLDIVASQDRDDVAQALVEIGPSGEVARVQVPTRPGENPDMPLPARIGSREIERALQARARLALATKP
jgi:hypothetical protein